MHSNLKALGALSDSQDYGVYKECDCSMNDFFFCKKHYQVLKNQYRMKI